MKTSANDYRALGHSGLRIPPLTFGTGALSNARRVIPDQTKTAICGEWFRHIAPPVLIELSPNAGDGRAVEVLARAFDRLGVRLEEAVVSVRFRRPERPFDYRGLRVLWDETCRALGKHRPRLVSLDAPSELGQPMQDFLDAYRALDELRAARQVAGIGVAVKDWRLVPEIDAAVRLDWVTMIGCFTILQHPRELFEFMASLAGRRVSIVNAGVFHCNFLAGGSRFDGRTLSGENPEDRSLLAWRKTFAALCQAHGVSPPHACIQFALAGPGVATVAINTTHPDRIAENVESAVTPVPDAFWSSMKEDGLLAADYPYGR